MDLSLVVHPIDMAGARTPAITLTPAAGHLIKEERRTVVWRQTLPDGTPAVIKLYRHRKPSWLQRRGWERGRAQREFDALRLLEARGIACSPALFWSTGHTEATGCYDLLATRQVPGACDLAAWLGEHPGCAPPDLAPLFGLIARMHRVGLQHGALLDRNILVVGGDFFLIDLPRSRYFVRSIAGRNPGLFDLRVLIQNLAPYCSDAALEAGLAGYPLAAPEARALIKAMRPRPLTNRRLNRWVAVYTVLSGCSRLFYRSA